MKRRSDICSCCTKYRKFYGPKIPGDIWNVKDFVSNHTCKLDGWRDTQIKENIYFSKEVPDNCIMKLEYLCL